MLVFPGLFFPPPIVWFEKFDLCLIVIVFQQYLFIGHAWTTQVVVYALVKQDGCHVLVLAIPWHMWKKSDVVVVLVSVF